jgi:hypothetical protein
MSEDCLQQKSFSDRQAALDWAQALVPPRVISSERETLIAVLRDPEVAAARVAAHENFAGKFRKVPKGSGLTPLPFVVHVEEAGRIAAEHCFGPTVVIACYRHDDNEDLGHSFDRIARESGQRVAELVSWVSQEDKGLSWEERNDRYAERLRQAPPDALAVSLADKISNLRSLVEYLEMGYSVGSLLKRSWRVNSEKFHRLGAIYEGQVPEEMLNRFLVLLAEFDVLGPQLESH